MSQRDCLKDTVISFLDKKSERNEKDEISNFFQNYNNSSEINELLAIIDIVEQENIDNMNQVISMSSNLEECFGKPLEQINSSFREFNQDFNSFQDSQAQFNESYDLISSKLLPLIIIDRNIDLASDLYKKLKIGLEEMDDFTRKFCVSEINPKELEKVVNYQLDKILVCHDYFQQITNPDALKIFNQKLGQWESEIVHTFQIEVNSLNNYKIFFDKFDQDKYTYAKIIKESILYKLYESEFDALSPYKEDIKLLTDTRKSEQFIYEFFKHYSTILSGLSTKFPNIETPTSFSQGIIHIFETIFKEVVDFIDAQLHSSNNFNFSFQTFHKFIQECFTKKKISKDIIDKADNIIQPVREKCSNELIQQWNKDIDATISQAFTNYQNNPNFIFEKTEKHAKSYKKIEINQKEDTDIISNSVYCEFQGKYIIQEVFEIILNFETDYDHKQSNLKEGANPLFTELLIDKSNLIIQNLNRIDVSKLDHKRSTILIILNTYDAISNTVSKFKSQRYNSDKKLLPLSKLESHHHSYMHAFISTHHFSSNNITQYFQHIQQYLVTDSWKTKFTILFTEHTIYIMSKIPELNETTLDKNAKKISKIYEYSIPILKDTSSIKRLYNRATAFFQNPQNSTMNELINSFSSKAISKKVEPNLVHIVNEMQK